MSEDIFITSIHIDKVCNIENFTIPLSETERKHLIITGKNGSGKTSLLLEINKFITGVINHSYNSYENSLSHVSNFESQLKSVEDIKVKSDLESSLKLFKPLLSEIGNTRINFINPYAIDKVFLSVLFEAKRFVQLLIPTGINKFALKEKYQSTEKINTSFIQFIVNLKAERSFAKDDNDTEAAAKIDAWFARFENSLKNLFDAPDLQLIFDRANYNFHIQIGEQEPFSLAQLSDGYSAVISILTELILRMEAVGNKSYDRQGIVLIDEIETHLHVSLQKKIMPFLCGFFPNIQFIVTTHSPFVLSSISNAVICDLEAKEVLTDLSGYSYDAIIENYFDVDQYSSVIKNKLLRFEKLSELSTLSESEQDEYKYLQDYFKNLPKFHADELAVKLQQIELKRIAG